MIGARTAHRGPRKWVNIVGAASAAMMLIAMPAMAQEEDETELVLRLNRAEEQVRQLTGMVEQLQHQNRMLQQQLQQTGPAPGSATAPAPAQGPRPIAPQTAQPSAQPSPQTSPQPLPQPTQGAQQVPPPPGDGRAAPGAIVTNEPAPQTSSPRGDVFDPRANPNAPGAPRALGELREDVGAPGGREAGAPLDIGRTSPAPLENPPLANPQGPARQAAAIPAPTTAPPSQTPKDLYDLGYGYVLRKDYALAEQTFDAFLKQYPSDALVPEAQYWLGEARFQRQNYRDAAEAFLAISTKHATAPRAPEALLRLAQSLIAMREKEAGCAALGEVARKYPRASAGVKQGVVREQKRAGC